MIMDEIAQATTQYSGLDVASVTQDILQQAQMAATGDYGKGLLKKLESRLHHFDQQAAAGTLMRLYGGLKSQHSHVDAAMKAGNELTPNVQRDIVVLAVLDRMTENTPNSRAVKARREMVLALSQQLDLAIKQAANLKEQVENAMMNIDNIRTSVLPSLGFMGAVTKS
jgi:hypothetical protein